MDELKLVISKKEQELAKDGLISPKVLAVCLSSRRNMCVHPKVSAMSNRKRVDAMCYNLTSSWARENATGVDEVCTFFEGLESGFSASEFSGIFSLEDIKRLGIQKGFCPYFLVRRLISLSNIIVYNYQYLLDPKIANAVSNELEKDCIVVFDEAHNIDNICIEALSVKIDRKILRSGLKNIDKLTQIMKDDQISNGNRLNKEYQELVQGISADVSLTREQQTILSAPVVAADMSMDCIPGNIRKAKNFLSFLRLVIEHLMTRLSCKFVVKQSPRTFVSELQVETKIQESQLSALKFCYERLNSLLRTLEVSNVDEFSPLRTITDFATLVSTYEKGFVVLMEPYDQQISSIRDPVLQLCCLDASIGMKPVFEKFRNVIITSGTLSPMDVYPKILSFSPKISECLPMSMSRNCIRPLIVTKGNDQVPLSSKFDSRDDAAVLSNYGRLLIDMSGVVPDGIICFFPSYKFMESIIATWDEQNILQKVLQNKLIFVEAKDIVETSMALEGFKKACDSGRGAVFICVARGKVAEGIDFDSHYGRCVIMFGVPFQYSKSNVLLARLEFLKSEYNIRESDFLGFDALRQAAQCVGRVIRSKQDYGLMVFADYRYSRLDKRKKLPKWIRQFLESGNMNMSIDRAVVAAQDFFRKMAQPQNDQDLKTTLLSVHDL
eukprot:116757_1